MRDFPQSIITTNPPAWASYEYDQLVDSLNTVIPSKSSNNVLIGTWNIKGFGSCNKVWYAQGNTSPKRDLLAVQMITEIISRFDVVAVQEVKGNLRALRYVMELLGSSWSFVMTDITLGDAGNSERLAFIFNRDRISLSGLACELVIPPEEAKELTEDTYFRQFARTPYAVSFKRKDATFILVTLHIDYGESLIDRQIELEATANWMFNWARRTTKWHQNLIVLGDFNIDREGSPLYDAFVSTGLYIPESMRNQPRSIFDDDVGPTSKYYDQIAWFTRQSMRSYYLDMEFIQGGNFDFVPFAYNSQNMSRSSMQHRISDHYPLWVEFRI